MNEKMYVIVNTYAFDGYEAVYEEVIGVYNSLDLATSAFNNLWDDWGLDARTPPSDYPYAYMSISVHEWPLNTIYELTPENQPLMAKEWGEL